MKRVLKILATAGAVALIAATLLPVYPARAATTYSYWTNVVGAGWNVYQIGNVVYSNWLGGVTNIFTNAVSVSRTLYLTNAPSWTTSIWYNGSTIVTNIYTNTMTIATNPTSEIAYYPNGNGNTYGTQNGHLSFYGANVISQQTVAAVTNLAGTAETTNVVAQINSVITALKNLGLVQ